MTPERLLTLSPERIALELRRAEQAEVIDRRTRRHRLLVLSEMGATYVGGLFLIGLAFNSIVFAAARYAFVAGLLLAGVGPVVVAYSAWQRANS